MKRFPKNRAPSNFGTCQSLMTRCKKSDQKLISEIPISQISMDGCADRYSLLYRSQLNASDKKYLPDYYKVFPNYQYYYRNNIYQNFQNIVNWTWLTKDSPWSTSISKRMNTLGLTLSYEQSRERIWQGNNLTKSDGETNSKHTKG